MKTRAVDRVRELLERSLEIEKLEPEAEPEAKRKHYDGTIMGIECVPGKRDTGADVANAAAVFKRAPVADPEPKPFFPPLSGQEQHCRVDLGGQGCPNLRNSTTVILERDAKAKAEPVPEPEPEARRRKHCDGTIMGIECGPVSLIATLLADIATDNTQGKGKRDANEVEKRDVIAKVFKPTDQVSNWMKGTKCHNCGPVSLQRVMGYE